MEYTLRLDTELITLNEYINAERASKFKAAIIKAEETNKVMLLAKIKKFKLPVNTKFDVEITWFKMNNRKDHDNIAFSKKFIFDGLIKAGILENDSPEFINNLSDYFIKTNDFTYCEVTFKELINK